MEQSRAEYRRELRAQNAFKKSMKRRYSNFSIYNQPVMVKPVEEPTVSTDASEVTATITTGEMTDSKKWKQNQKMLRSTITLPFFGKNRSAKRSKIRMCNKKHTDGRKAHNKIHKHLNNAI